MDVVVKYRDRLDLEIVSPTSDAEIRMGGC